MFCQNYALTRERPFQFTGYVTVVSLCRFLAFQVMDLQSSSRFVLLFAGRCLIKPQPHYDCCCLPCKCRSYLPPASDPLVPVLWLRAVDQSKASMLRASVVVASKFRVLILSAMYGGRYARIMHRIGISKFMRPIHPDLYPSVFCLICSVE